MLNFVGDLMHHKILYDRGYDNLKYVSGILQNSDLTIGNLETPVSDMHEVSGYPLFNANTNYLLMLASAGFDIVTYANNHSYDKGLSGFFRTLTNLKKFGINYVGVGSSNEFENIFFTNIHEIRFAFLAYSYGFNGKDYGYVNLAKFRSTTTLSNILDLVKFVRSQVDVIILLPHWGEEYTVAPNSYLIRHAHDLINSGVDIIVGCHSHSLHQVEIYKERIIAYSLGSFVSAYTTFEGTRQSMILHITVNKTGNRTSFSHSCTPTYLENYKVIDLSLRTNCFFINQRDYIFGLCGSKEFNISYTNMLRKQMIEYRRRMYEIRTTYKEN